MFVQEKSGIGHICFETNEVIPLTLIFNKFQIANGSLGKQVWKKNCGNGE